ARAWAIACDVTDEASVQRLGAEALEHLGAVDILVNDAGASSSAPLARITLDEWNRLMEVNATGAFLCTREFLAGMLERRRGRVAGGGWRGGAGRGEWGGGGPGRTTRRRSTR